MDTVAGRLSGLMLAGLAGAALAATTPAGLLSVRDAWARPTPPGITVGVVYLTVGNRGSATDRLLRLTSPIASAVQLHQTRSRDGVSSMRELPFVDVPANGELSAAPGGLHIMLLGLKRPLIPGEKFPLTMTFAHGGELAVDVTVKSAP